MAQPKLYTKKTSKRIIIDISLENSAKGVRDNDYVMLMLLANKEGKTAMQKSLKQFIQRKLKSLAEGIRRKQATLFEETKPIKK